LDQLKKIVFTLLFILSVANSSAQDKESSTNANELPIATEERVFLHTNTTTFLSGETLYYKMYCLNPLDNTASRISQIGYVVLLDEAKKEIFNSKIALTDGSGQGDFFIPTTLKTGNYKLLSYTLWMLNRDPVAAFESDILIINPFQTEEKRLIKSTTLPGSEKQVSDLSEKRNSEIIPETLAELSTNNKTYLQREKVVMKIKGLNQKPLLGNFSISVRKKEEYPFRIQTSTMLPTNSGPALVTNPNSILPELRGELVTGSIISKNGNKNSARKTIALSIPGKSLAFKVTQTNDDGKFSFVLDKNPTADTSVLQLFEEDRDQFELKIDKPITYDFSKVTFPSPFVIPIELKKTIEERSIANQIENAYFRFKKDSLIANPTTPSFFHPLEKDYILDEYTRFPTMAETITEILTEMYYKKNKGKYSIYLRDNLSNAAAYGTPLVLVDGELIQEANELFDLDMNTIYKVSIVNQGYVYGPKIFSGVVNFVTKNNDFQSKSVGDFSIKTRLQRPLPIKKYNTPNYDITTALARIPDYRYQLLWMPDVTLEQIENSLLFYTSDVIGTFEIIVKGFTKEGTAISLYETFEVK